MQFFGFTRFSIYSPKSPAWHLAKNDNEEYLKKLFSDDRLQPRFEIFFERALPVYQAMANEYAYKHILSYSSRMPEKWKDKIKEMGARYPVLILDEIDGDPQPHKIMERELKGKKSSIVVFFRVDDDDLLSADYLKRLSKYAKRDFIGMAVTFGRGLSAVYENGKFKDFREVYRRLLAIGLAYIGNYDSLRKTLVLPKTGNHIDTEKYSPVISDSRSPVFVWTKHLNQDSYSHPNTTNPSAIFNKSVSEYERIETLDDLPILFPGLSSDLLEFEKLTRPVPIISNAVAVKKQKILLADLTLSGQFEFRLIASGGSEHLRGAILTFEVDGNLQEINGLYSSASSDVGLFRYLAVSKQNVTTTFTISLLKNTRVRIYCRSWKDISENIIIKSAQYKQIA